jgi:hypothetical protein
MADPTCYFSVRESAAAASKRHLVVWNGSAVTLKVYHIRASGHPAAAVTGLVIPLTVYRIDSAPVGGSAGVIVKADTDDASPPGTITCTTGATSGANEVGPVAFGVVTGEEAVASMSDDLFTAPIDGSAPLLLRPNQGILVKQNALASAGAVSIIARIGVA